MRMVAALLLGGWLGGVLWKPVRLVAEMPGSYLSSTENEVASAVTPTACFSWGER
jgi:hypothetical protein